MTELAGLALHDQVPEATITGWYLDLPQPGSWSACGACRYEDPAIFFPSRGGDVRAAVAVCARCPVQTECLEYALAAGWRLTGIWGGVTEPGRHRLRQQRRLQGEP